MNGTNKLPKGKYDPLKMLQTGQSFLKAAKRCYENRAIDEKSFEFLLVPAIVNEAFSCEVFLKALLMYQGDALKGDPHSLYDLWKQLSPDVQAEILKICGYDQNSRDAFEINLGQISPTFKEWRYIYEFEKATLHSHFLDALANALQEVANRIIK